MQKVTNTARHACRFMKRNLGKIAYYACLALVLAAIAFAAEQYRREAAEQPEIAAVQSPAAAQLQTSEALVDRPASALLLRGFDKYPAWNTALRCWEVHQATDYQIEGNRVTCAYPGAISDVGESGRLGGFVIIDSDWLRILYASVTPDADIAPGQRIEAGKEFAEVDDSLPGEAGMGPHLHIECFVNGNMSDFEALIGKNEHAYD